MDHFETQKKGSIGKARFLKKKYVPLYILIVLLLGIFVTTLIYTEWYLLEIRYVPMDIRIEDIASFDTRNDYIHFGGIPPGANAKRNFTLTNSYTMPVKIVLSAQGDIAPWVKISNETIFLEPGVRETIDVRAYPPKDTVEGNYTGILKIIIKRG